jgi:thioredoxin-like negative regulator of GroEL
MVKTIEPQAFDIELQSSSELFLVAFLKRNEKFSYQLKIIEDASRKHGDKVCCYLYNSDYLETAMQRFSVKGTPTFILFSEGCEVDRLIGESDAAALDEFISNIS